MEDEKNCGCVMIYSGFQVSENDGEVARVNLQSHDDVVGASVRENIGLQVRHESQSFWM